MVSTRPLRRIICRWWTTPPVASQGVIAALPDGSQLVSKAFQSKQGDPPQFAQTGEGYAIFQVTGVAAAHAPNFADFKSHVLDDYRQEQLPVLLSQKTKELSDKARSMNDLSKAAKEVGATLKTSDLVGQAGQVPDFGQVARWLHSSSISRWATSADRSMRAERAWW